MDERLRQLERTFRESPEDGDVAQELGRLYLRAARPARALTVLRPQGEGELRDQAGESLAERMGCSFNGVVDGFERFGRTDLETVLIPGGAFLEDGATAYTSSLEPGGSRAPLARIVLPDYLISRVVRPAPTHDAARDAALALGQGRLPTPEQWKKAWRGGLFLDGDETALLPNPAPDRIAPWGFDDPPLPGEPAVSPYGLELDLHHLLACEWSRGSAELGLVLKVESGRYQIPLRTPSQRRNLYLAYRVVYEVPSGL